MGGPLVATVVLLFLLTPLPAAPKPLSGLSPEARRLAQSLVGWDWPQDESSGGLGPGPGPGNGGGGPNPLGGPGGLGAASDDSEDSEQRSWEIVPIGVAGSKRALSVLSRFTPFTSLGTRRMGRYPARSRGPSVSRDYISAETRGDFSDRPSGQPLRWGR